MFLLSPTSITHGFSMRPLLFLFSHGSASPQPLDLPTTSEPPGKAPLYSVIQHPSGTDIYHPNSPINFTQRERQRQRDKEREGGRERDMSVHGSTHTQSNLKEEMTLKSQSHLFAPCSPNIAQESFSPVHKSVLGFQKEFHGQELQAEVSSHT